MDTSKEYIKMCEKAKEIQKNRPSLSNGVFNDSILNEISYCSKHEEINKLDGNRFIICPETEKFNDDTSFDRISNIEPCNEENWIWLPRQDQLQEIY